MVRPVPAVEPEHPASLSTRRMVVARRPFGTATCATSAIDPSVSEPGVSPTVSRATKTLYRDDGALDFDHGGTRTVRKNVTAPGTGLLDDDPSFSSRLADAAAHEPAAIRALVDEFVPDLVAFMRRRGVTDPEGSANQAMFDALQNLSGLRSRTRRTFRSYLYKIARRRVVDEIRRNSVRPRVVASLVNGDQTATLTDDHGSRFDERIADEDYVDALLTTLTADQRRILELRLLDDRSIQETAELTGRSVTAVKAMQRRAITSLRIAAAAMVAVLLVIGGRLLLADERPIMVENAPATDDGITTGPDGDDPTRGPTGQGGPDEPDGDGLPTSSTDETGAGDPEGERGTVVAGASSTPADATGVDDDPPDGPPGDGPPTNGPNDGGGASDIDGTGDGADPPGGAQDSPAPVTTEPAPDRPCRIISRPFPVVGEIAWVVFQLDRPFDLFRGTSGHVIGDAGDASAMTTGWETNDRLWNGRTHAFRVEESMLNDNGRLRPKVALAGGEVTSRCTYEIEHTSPCSVTTDGAPRPGDRATVTYDPTGGWSPLLGRWTAIMAADGSSARVGGGSTEIAPGATATFVIDESMITDDGVLDVRSWYRRDQGFVVCATE